ncbi:MAG: GTP 3',8-cyclase MoaA [Bradymonadales bacterium]|nr:GTP 3',8-cyclase MoaA [Bradymonadales bacterium]
MPACNPLSKPSSPGVYLRLSVTDRCNLRCRYCMPKEGVRLLPRGEILSLERMAALVFRLAQAVPVNKVRLTGGEPLVRKGLCFLVERLADLPGHPPLVMTTNGTLLAPMASLLRQLGIRRVNISIDTLQPDRYHELTGGQLDDVLAGIDAAQQAGFETVKLNTVLLGGINDDELSDLTRFALARGLQIRFIELMKRGPSQQQESFFHYIPAQRALDLLRQSFDLTPLDSIGTTAVMYQVTWGERKGEVGVITPVSHPFCQGCQRLRLDARGHLFPCLMSDRQVDLTPYLQATTDNGQLADLIRQQLDAKLTARAELCSTPMSRIGG